MLTIGLTGGIGCGKSTAAAVFSELQVPVIDADAIAHQIVEPGQATLELLLERFGAELKQADGLLDRAALRELVFNDSDRRQELEAIMHPAIRKEMLRQRESIDADYCVLVIPLLVESGQQAICDRILALDCSESTQRERVLRRPGLSEPQFNAILQAQCSRPQRLAVADDVIINDSDDIDLLRQEIFRLHQQYIEMSKNA